jgi:hypothetical protein
MKPGANRKEAGMTAHDRMMDGTDDRRHYAAMIDTIADALDERRRRDEATVGLIPALYLYCAPGTPGVWGGLAVLEDAAPPFTILASPERVPFGLPYGQATRDWIAERSRYLPILPTTPGLAP